MVLGSNPSGPTSNRAKNKRTDARSDRICVPHDVQNLIESLSVSTPRLREVPNGIAASAPSVNCELGRPWTTFADASKPRGCNCTPLYHVVHRVDGKLVREPVGQNRKEAERALDARRGDVARREYRVLRDIRFDEWADAWLESFRREADNEDELHGND